MHKIALGLIVGNSEGKETASIPRNRWENNIKLHLKGIGWEGMDWMILYILYNQCDATYTMFFIIISALHVSAGFSAHHQELIKLYVQP